MCSQSDGYFISMQILVVSGLQICSLAKFILWILDSDFVALTSRLPRHRIKYTPLQFRGLFVMLETGQVNLKSELNYLKPVLKYLRIIGQFNPTWPEVWSSVSGFGIADLFRALVISVLQVIDFCFSAFRINYQARTVYKMREHKNIPYGLNKIYSTQITLTHNIEKVSFCLIASWQKFLKFEKCSQILKKILESDSVVCRYLH